jgi:hypothetical protein
LEPRVEGFTVVNSTEEDLQIVYLDPADREDGEVNLNRIAAGATIIAAGAPDCTAHPVVARTDDGTEIARREPPICKGDTWVIENP